MNLFIWLLLSFCAGLVLGVLYFSGLWLTVRRLSNSWSAAGWLLGSFVLRTAIVLFGIYIVANGQWERILACLVGFIVARSVAIRLLGDLDSTPRSLQGLTNPGSGQHGNQ